jgi:hypothetical protein
MRASSHESFRYSNTLLVSLNNRIYFRDHPASAVVDSGLVVDSDQARRSAVASLHFSQGPPPLHTNTIDEGFKLHTISRTMDLEKGKGDAVSISSGPR